MVEISGRGARASAGATPSVRHALRWLVWFAVLWGFWFLLVGEWNRIEVVAATCVALVGATVAEVVLSWAGVRVRVPLAWVWRAKTTPLMIPVDRVFLGLGPKEDRLLSEQPEEEPSERAAAYAPMIAVVAVMIALGLAASAVPGLHVRAEQAAERFRDRAAYIDLVLHGKRPAPPPRLAYSVPAPPLDSWLYGIGAAAIALATALFGLYRQRLQGAIRATGARILAPPLEGVRELHSGLVGDYVTWLAVGTATIGAIWALALR